MMFGFLGKGKGKAGQQNGPPVQTTSATSSNMFSSQAAAALAAAAAAGNVPGNAGPAPTGRRLQGTDVTVDLDALRPGEKVPELQVQPITLLKFDYKLEHTQQVAISSSFICYGLKAGHIRALNRNTASRALFKGHPTSLSHMAFFSAASNLLASASRQGDLAVRLLTDGVGPEGDAVPAETLLMRAQLALPPGADVTSSSSSSPPVSLAWHPSTPQILAAGAGGSVNIFQVPTTPPAEQPPELSAPGIQYALPSSGSSSAAVTAVAFSPAGDLLVAADSAGSVHVWWLEGDGEEGEAPMLSWQPLSGSSSAAAAAAAAAVASVQFLHQADDGSSILMIGDARNAALKLWLLPPAAALNGASPACLQAVQFVSSANGPSDVFCHAVVQRELQLLVLANTVRKQVYTLHYSLGGSAVAAFDYAAFWGVMQPILSLATGLEAVESQAVPGEVAPQQLLLYTVQTDAIQQYSINPALCSSSGSGGEDESAAAAAHPAASLAAADAASAAAGGAAAAAANVEEGEEEASAAAAAAPAAAAASADVAALQQQVAQLLEMQQAMAAQLQASSQQTVAGVKGELSRALKATEASLAKQVEASLKATAKRSEEERRKAAAKERGELAAQLEKSMAAQLGQVSAALQRDLLKGMADAAREQSRATVTAVVNSVSPVVAQAVAGSLQRELAGSAGGGGQLAAVLERSLASSLAQPLHEALRENFAASIIPAFERATQVMFGQVESAFTAWLADSSRTAGAAQSEAAASLSSSLQQLQAVVGSMRGDLADTSRSLSRIASSTASRAAEASSSGGAGPRTAQQLEAGAGAAGAAAAAPADPRIEIGSLMSVRKYDEALVKALNTASLEVLVWACKQVDPQVVLGGSSVALSQTTLLSLVHQLSSGLVNDAATPLKLAWLAEAAPVVDPHDPVTAPHLKVVLTGVMSSLKALVNSLPQNDVMAKKGKITLHLFNSLLHHPRHSIRLVILNTQSNMKLAIAVLALLCIGAHAHGIPSVSIEKTNEGVKSPEVTVKLPAVTVPVPKINVSMPEIRLPKISMPGQGKNINLQVPTVDVQGLLNAALNKPMPSINMTNLAALLSKPAMPSLNLDLSGLLSKPSVNISALAGMIPKPSIDLSGLQALMAAKPSVSVENMPDAAEIISALLAKGTSDMNAVVALISALSTKPNITLPTVALNIPQINMPQMPQINMPNINLPQMPSVDLNMLVKAATALKGNREPAEIATQVVGMINSLMNAKPAFPALNLTIPKPVFPSFNFSTPQIDISGLVAAAANMKPMPSIDLSGLATLALSKPMPQINLALPDITALTNLALNKQHVNLTLPAIEALVNIAAAKASLLPNNITLLPEVTAILSTTKLPSMDLSAITSMLRKPNIDLSGLTSMLQKPNVTLPDVNAILTAALAQHTANMQAFASAATGVISALAAKPSVQLPDLSALFSKNMTLPTIAMPSISMPNIDLSGVVSALLAKPANDLAALNNVITALATKPNITMPNLTIDLSGLTSLLSAKPSLPNVDLSGLSAMLDKNMTIPTPQLPTLQIPGLQLPTMPSMDLSADKILALLSQHAGLKPVHNVTLPNGQVVIDLANSAIAAKQSALNSAVSTVNGVASQVQAAKQSAVNSAVGAVNGAVAAQQGAAKQVLKQVQGQMKKNTTTKP
ncbi:hypothetical protein OEZ85_006696 [Tetradesmus obliquus]|uniref:Enhancer of mRNA-decapping protein 4 C-terminal domain-containing protein n=1 Tax=Tetradesmus obliquus TaxID=3088 RepID=A0ABY8TZH8_TETOB|nr:hypothetical protein OEZ85_006696 [Tetradesmus obliquus]